MPFAFEHVRVEGAARPRLDDVSAQVPARGLTVVAGPSGAGKSTLLRLANRLLAPDAGRVLLDGEDLARLDPLRLRRRAGMVFQRPVLFAGTVRDNLRVAAPEAGEEELGALLERCELRRDVLDREADTLSGGEAQRACLARCLATGPEVLLMDEPTSALDAPAAAALERLLAGQARDGVPVLLVTHDPGQVRRLADHLLVLDDGRLVQDGPAEEVLASPGAALAALLAEEED